MIIGKVKAAYCSGGECSTTPDVNGAVLVQQVSSNVPSLIPPQAPPEEKEISYWQRALMGIGIGLGVIVSIFAAQHALVKEKSTSWISTMRKGFSEGHKDSFQQKVANATPAQLQEMMKTQFGDEEMVLHYVSAIDDPLSLTKEASFERMFRVASIRSADRSVRQSRLTHTGEEFVINGVKYNKGNILQILSGWTALLQEEVTRKSGNNNTSHLISTDLLNQRLEKEKVILSQLNKHMPDLMAKIRAKDDLHVTIT